MKRLVDFTTQFGLVSEVSAYSYSELNGLTLEKVFRLRKKVFIDEKQWTIGSYKGGDFECDDHDDDHSHYIILTCDNALTGCVRLRPSIYPTLMSGTLHWLKEPVSPSLRSDETMWEATRFFVTSNKAGRKGPGGFAGRTQALFLGMIEFGIFKGFSSYEVVVDEAMARIVRMSGWQLEILNSGLGTLNENVYYGLLPCNVDALGEIIDTAERRHIINPSSCLRSGSFISSSYAKLSSSLA